MINIQLKILGSFFVCVAFCIIFSNVAQASYLLSVFDDNLNVTKSVSIDRDSRGIFSDFNTIDLGGDGINEFVITEGYQYQPKVMLYRYDGSKINEWQPYPNGYEGRINVVAGDLDNDGKDEVITVPGEGGGPHVRIFDGYGNVKGSFFAFDEMYRDGLEVALADTNNDNQLEILVSILDENKNIVRFFDINGNILHNDIVINVEGYFEPMKIVAFDLNGDNKDELIFGGSIGGKPFVYVLDSKTGKTHSFLAFAESFRGGVDVTAAKVQGKNVIIAGAGFSGGPHVRFFDMYGNVQFNPRFFVYDSNFRGGLNISVGNFGSGEEMVVYPQTITENSSLASFGKVIRVDLSEQRLYAYDRGRLIKSFLISSGRSGFETPLGNFHVYKKRDKVRMSWYYGPNNPNNYDVPGVPYVLSFNGPYTIHATWWHSNWGHVMSHGCVNVSMDLAKWLYEWTPLNTPVIIEQ